MPTPRVAPMKMGLPTLLGRKLAPVELQEVEELSCAQAAQRAFLAQQEPEI